MSTKTTPAAIPDPEQIAIEEPAETTDLISMAQITVTQLPIIEERLRSVKDAVLETVAEAKSMIATADTVQAVKTRRAELNKQFAALEEQRKTVKQQIMAPYDKFNEIYKLCIEKPFRDADAALKNTVDDFEGELKKKALARLEEYYGELCSLEQIDWLPFEEALNRSGLKITMADCRTKEPRRAMDTLGAFLAGIGNGMEQIRMMDDAPEIVVEFKKTLDAGAAIATVAERKRKIREAAAAELKRREEEAARAEMAAKIEAAAPTPAPAPVATPTENPEQAEKIWPEFRFTVYNCTRTQLIKIREFLKTEGIEYGK